MKLAKLKRFSLTLMAFSILNLGALFFAVLLTIIFPFISFVFTYTLLQNFSLFFLYDLMNEIKFIFDDYEN